MSKTCLAFAVSGGNCLFFEINTIVIHYYVMWASHRSAEQLENRLSAVQSCMNSAPGLYVSLFLCRTHIHLDPTKVVVCLTFSLEMPMSICSQHHFWSVIWDRKAYRACLEPILPVPESPLTGSVILVAKNELNLDMLLLPCTESHCYNKLWSTFDQYFKYFKVKPSFFGKDCNRRIRKKKKTLCMSWYYTHGTHK